MTSVGIYVDGSRVKVICGECSDSLSEHYPEAVCNKCGLRMKLPLARWLPEKALKCSTSIEIDEEGDKDEDAKIISAWVASWLDIDTSEVKVSIS